VSLGYGVWLLRQIGVLHQVMTDKNVPGYGMPCESGTVSSETSEETRAMKNKEAIRVVFERLEQIYTEPRSQLLGPIADDPVDTLVATILSQATNDTLSSRAFSQLKSQFPQWEDLLCEDCGVVEGVLSCAGLYRQKTKKIMGALNEIKENFGEITLDPLKSWPKERCFEYLTSLPGVGPKTAACVLVFGLGKPAIPVDTHILRVIKRLGIVDESASAPFVQQVLEDTVPDEEKMPLHLMLIEHGRKVCTARKPKCGVCPLQDVCKFFGSKENTEKIEGIFPDKMK